MCARTHAGRHREIERLQVRSRPRCLRSAATKTNNGRARPRCYASARRGRSPYGCYWNARSELHVDSSTAVHASLGHGVGHPGFRGDPGKAEDCAAEAGVSTRQPSRSVRRSSRAWSIEAARREVGRRLMREKWSEGSLSLLRVHRSGRLPETTERRYARALRTVTPGQIAPNVLRVSGAFAR